MRAALKIIPIFILTVWCSGILVEAKGDEVVFGDMIMTPEEKARLLGTHHPKNIRQYSVIQDTGKNRWPNNLVPYEFSSEYTPKEKQVIKESLQEIQQKTCFKFREKIQSDKDYVFFNSSRGLCASEVGRRGGKQHLYLFQKAGCVDKTTIQHEMLHSLGFYHEHQRHDRDQYIDVLWENIVSSANKVYVKTLWGKNLVKGMEKYDIRSIMHYNSMSAAVKKDPKTGKMKPTMVIKGTKTEIPRNMKLSPEDINKLNILGNCANKKNGVGKKPSKITKSRNKSKL